MAKIVDSLAWEGEEHFSLELYELIPVDDFKENEGLVFDEKLHCHICSRNFSSRHYLQHHIKFVHSNERRFPCKHCPKSFKAPTHLKLHTARLHSGGNVYTCPECGSR